MRALLPIGAFLAFLGVFLPIVGPLLAELHQLTLAQSASVLHKLSTVV